jgi:hypothetical protein
MLRYFPSRQIAIERFVDDVAVEAVEKGIVARLNDIVSPVKITSLTSDVMRSIAGESEESRAKRKQLENQLDVLVQGLETCNRFMIGTLQGKQVTMFSTELCRYDNCILMSGYV